jgi:hypothetical protein
MNAIDQPLERERKDLRIPLAGKDLNRQAIAGFVNPLIQQQLTRAEQTGWQSDGPTDVFALWRAGRVEVRQHTSFWSDKHTYSLSSVTIRLVRISTA